MGWRASAATPRRDKYESVFDVSFDIEVGKRKRKRRLCERAEARIGCADRGGKHTGAEELRGGQAARNRGNRGHGVSAEIKKKKGKKKKRKPPCMAGRVHLAGRKGCCWLLACFGSNTKHLWLSASAGLRLRLYFRTREAKKYTGNRFDKSKR